MGDAFAVYDAWSQARRCRCTVKMLAPGITSSLLDRRLRREGRLLTRLDHPHLLHAYEVGTDPAFVASRTLTGCTLGRLLDDGARLTGGDLAVLAGQLASGLAYLHDSGHLHLDVKPGNVVVDNGLAVLIDLSLAQRSRRVPSGTGTPWYMSPEQARGGPVDAAADVWGLGITLFHAATGHLAFAQAWERGDIRRGGPLPQQTMRAPRLLRRRRGLPGALTRMIDGCLEPSPGDRPTLTEIATVVRDLTGEGPPRRPAAGPAAAISVPRTAGTPAGAA